MPLESDLNSLNSIILHLTGVRSLASLLVFDSDLSVTLKTLACHSLITYLNIKYSELQILMHWQIYWLTLYTKHCVWVLWDIQNRWHKVFLSYRISTWLKIHAQFDFSLAVNSMEWACNKFSIRFPSTAKISFLRLKKPITANWISCGLRQDCLSFIWKIHYC